MPKVATWMRACDEPFFARAFAPFSGLQVCNAALDFAGIDDVGGLLLTGGPDVAPDFLLQPVPDPSILDIDADPARDRWEIEAVKQAVARGLPILAICKGMQVLNVALGGTLLLDIPLHNSPEMKDADLQPLRLDASAAHRFESVNSSHHQALERLADGLSVEAWSASDDIIEQVRLRAHPFAVGVQYHPERGTIYGALFADFASRVAQASSLHG